jgi:hypothetical protein
MLASHTHLEFEAILYELLGAMPLALEEGLVWVPLLNSNQFGKAET